MRRQVGAAIVVIVASIAGSVAGCSDDRRRGGDDDDDGDGSGCVFDCAETEEGGGDGDGSGSAGGSAVSSSSASVSSSSGTSGTPPDMHLPECVAWVNHVCQVCGSNCGNVDWFEETVSACDSFYEGCEGKFACETAAPTCTAAADCPGCD